MSPFVNKSQSRAFYAKEARGEMKPGTAAKWAAETPGGIKSLPERGKKKRAATSGASATSGKTGGGRSTTRAATTPSLSPSSANSISVPSKLGIARKLPDFTSATTARKATSPRSPRSSRTLTLPRAAGNRYARRGTPRSQMRSYRRGT